MFGAWCWLLPFIEASYVTKKKKHFTIEQLSQLECFEIIASLSFDNKPSTLMQRKILTGRVRDFDVNLPLGSSVPAIALPPLMWNVFLWSRCFHLRPAHIPDRAHGPPGRTDILYQRHWERLRSVFEQGPNSGESRKSFLRPNRR